MRGSHLLVAVTSCLFPSLITVHFSFLSLSQMQFLLVRGYGSSTLRFLMSPSSSCSFQASGPSGMVGSSLLLLNGGMQEKLRSGGSVLIIVGTEPRPSMGNVIFCPNLFPSQGET